jgi:hypothetical protein
METPNVSTLRDAFVAGGWWTWDENNSDPLPAIIRTNLEAEAASRYPEPKMYPLLHHAAAFARQLEAAGMPHARWSLDRDAVAQFWWPRTATADVTGEIVWWTVAGHETQRQSFCVGDPWPDALVAAIKATEGANG